MVDVGTVRAEAVPASGCRTVGADESQPAADAAALAPGAAGGGGAG